MIIAYQPFILSIVSKEKNQYINIDNDEEYQIGLLAFYEAIKKYDNEKGSFFHFYRIVIKSRFNNYWEKEKKISKYAANLIQLENGKKINPNPQDCVCEDCGVNEDLWLNLSTG